MSRAKVDYFLTLEEHLELLLPLEGVMVLQALVWHLVLLTFHFFGFQVLLKH